MAKVRLIVVILLLSLGSLSIGFAWTGTIAVAATVQTEALQVCVREAAIKHDGTLTAQTSITGDTVRFTIGGMYPGAEVTLHVKTINAGRHSVRFRGAEITTQGDSALMTYLQVESGYQYDHNGDRRVDGGASVSTNWRELGDIAKAMNDHRQLKNMVLAPGGSFYLGTPLDNIQGAQDHEFRIRLSESAPNAVQNTSASFELKLNWEQVIHHDEDDDRDDDRDDNRDDKKRDQAALGYGSHDNDILSRWTGQVELRWRKSAADNRGAVVIGDLHLVCRDGSRPLFVEAAVQGSSLRWGQMGSQAVGFVVAAGRTGNYYRVLIPRDPVPRSTIVSPTFVYSTELLPKSTLPNSAPLQTQARYAQPWVTLLPGDRSVASVPQFFLVDGLLPPGQIRAASISLIPIDGLAPAQILR